MIPFNKPFFTGKEPEYISDAVHVEGHISGNGKYTKLCQSFFEKQYGFQKCLLTTSCTDALEMAAILLDIRPGDEVIMPSYTFVSTAIAFVRQGAKIVFCDSRSDFPGMDERQLPELITSKTKAIVVVHYAGIACDMDPILEIATDNNLFVVEDAAQAIDATYKGKSLGGIGHIGCFSFHETKNISCGEGGLLVINDSRFVKRAEIIWEKGTNRAAFFRGQINKYGWVDIGSSFLPSDLNAAFLYAQIQELKSIQKRRLAIWCSYREGLKSLFDTRLISQQGIPDYATNNGHMFYFVCKSLKERTGLILFLKSKNIMAVFHYQSLHNSEYYRRISNQTLEFADMFTDTLVRLPLYVDLSDYEVQEVCKAVREFYA